MKRSFGMFRKYKLYTYKSLGNVNKDEDEKCSHVAIERCKVMHCCASIKNKVGVKIENKLPFSF